MASGDDVAGPSPGDDPDLAATVSEKLREAHLRLSALPPGGPEKARAGRRMIAITNAARHHLPTAARRLDAFLADLDAGRYG